MRAGHRRSRGRAAVRPARAGGAGSRPSARAASVGGAPGVGFELEVVLLGGAFGGLAPRETVEHPAPAALAQTIALALVVEGLHQLHGQRVRIAPGHGHPALAPRAPRPWPRPAA